MSDAPRKIAVIVALDVAGYSARTEADEARATAEVAGLRGVIEGIAKHHAGRVFNTAGDGFMLEFGSSLAAVEAALALAEACEPKVRVGVHLGDVVVQPNGDLLGHGVNVAARLMAQAAPGSALVSADVRRTIRGPLAERLVSRGSLKLDKMAETIEAFAIAAVASAIAAVQPQPAEPMLAVLPFDNLSNDPEMQFLSDGISEEILQMLAHRSGLKVFGRTSAFHFRGAMKAEAARTLRATHVLDGAVRRSGSRLRVSAQLTDGASGASLWSERYDREFAEVFDLQDDIARNVADALETFLAPRARRGMDPIAYELMLRAREQSLVWTDDGFRKAATLLEEAIRRAPQDADAWANLGAARAMLLSREEDTTGTPQHGAAREAVERALALDPACATAYHALGILQPAFANHAEKIKLATKGFELAPGIVDSHVSMGGALGCVGRWSESGAHMIRAAELEPLSPFIAGMGATALFLDGRADEAFVKIEEAIRRLPSSLFLSTNKFALLRLAGRDEDALKFLDEEQAKNASWYADVGPQMRFMLTLPSFPIEQQRAVFEAALSAERDKVLRIHLCQAAATLGFRDLAFDHLFRALDTGRPIASIQAREAGANRSVILFVFFSPFGKALRDDTRFPAFCQRVGLVEYWMTSGHWPDCANDVPYDFKAECEKVAREVAKT